MPAGPHQIKFTPENVESILRKIKRTIPYKLACLSTGVSEKSFYLWKYQGIKDLEMGKDTPHAEFVKRLSNIEAERIGEAIYIVENAQEGHKGKQWLLEKGYWKYFSPRTAEIELNERVEALERQKGIENDETINKEEELCSQGEEGREEDDNKES